MKPITVPAGTKISIERVGDEQIIMFEPETKEPEFKDGDILVSGYDGPNGPCYWISILKGEFDKHKYYYYISYFYKGNHKIKHDDFCTAHDYTRLPTEDEKQILFDALERNGKKWNPDTKQVEDILKAGDLAILWDEKKMDSFIAVIKKIGDGGYPFISHLCSSKNAIKCTSVEQYLNFIKE